MRKFVFAIALFAVTAFAASNVFHVTVEDTVWIGANKVKPDNYKIEVENGKATLKAGKTVIEAPAKIEATDHKFDSTGLVLDTVGATQQLRAIEIGGRAERIVFETPQTPTE